MSLCPDSDHTIAYTAAYTERYINDSTLFYLTSPLHSIRAQRSLPIPPLPHNSSRAYMLDNQPLTGAI